MASELEMKRGQGVLTSWVSFDLKEWVEEEARKRKWTKSQFIFEALKQIKDSGKEVQ